MAQRLLDTPEETVISRPADDARQECCLENGVAGLRGKNPHEFEIGSRNAGVSTGRSFYYDPKLIAPGWQLLDHSPNDFVQILYSWGLVLVAYLAFWAALLRLIYSRFLVHKEYWPSAHW